MWHRYGADVRLARRTSGHREIVSRPWRRSRNLTDKFNKTATDFVIEADKMPVAELLKKHEAKSSARPKAANAKAG